MAFPAFIGQATCGGEPGDRSNRLATFVICGLSIAPILAPNHFRFAFVA
ncbi:hypothetical protein [Reyranella sp.]|nr:hypothetical protein [Reyranella sp.]